MSEENAPADKTSNAKAALSRLRSKLIPNRPEAAEGTTPDAAGDSTAETVNLSKVDDGIGPDGTATESAAAEGADPAAPSPAKRHMSASTTRRVLAAVAVGAVVAAVGTIAIAGGFKKPTELETHQPGEDPKLSAVEGEAFGTAVQGDCLTWTTSTEDIGKIDCSEPHQFEVASELDLSLYPGREFGPGSAFPGVLRFTELQDEHCVPAVDAYLGAKFDPQGKFDVGLIFPSEAGWNAGQRTLRCGIKFAKTNGALMPITGTATGQDQSKIWETGTCVGIDRNLPTDPVDCSQPHAFEVSGIVDLTTQFPGGPPSSDDQDKYLTDTCAKITDEYLGSPDTLRNKTLTMFFPSVEPMSWLAGSHRVNCMVGKGSGAEGFAPIIGTAKGDILIDGQPPVPPPAVPEGRALPTPLPGAAPAPIPGAAPAPR